MLYPIKCLSDRMLEKSDTLALTLPGLQLFQQGLQCRNLTFGTKIGQIRSFFRSYFIKCFSSGQNVLKSYLKTPQINYVSMNSKQFIVHFVIDRLFYFDILTFQSLNRLFNFWSFNSGCVHLNVN